MYVMVPHTNTHELTWTKEPFCRHLVKRKNPKSDLQIRSDHFNSFERLNAMGTIRLKTMCI